MRIFPIIPVWLMAVICIILIIYEIKGRENFLHVLIIVLLFLINLRIMFPTNNSNVVSNNLDVLFVIDNTISMQAEDYNGSDTRLNGVKNDCKYIIDNLDGARFSIITFNNTSKIITPFTKDKQITIQQIEIISPLDELYAKGSSLNTPLEAIKTSLNSSNEDQRIRILFFISDGEITDNSSLSSYSEIKKLVSNGAVLGYGTTSGGYMKVKEKYSDKEIYVMDRSDYPYKKAISRINESNLKQIASDINVDYINMHKQNNIDNKINEIKGIMNSSLEIQDKSSYEDIYYIFVIPLLLLITSELNKCRRNFG